MIIDRDYGYISGGYFNLGSVEAGVASGNELIDIDYSASAYASDDYMVAGLSPAYYNSTYLYDGGGVMVTSPDGVEDDYASWGYWGASFGDPATTGFEFVPVSTWVAGNVADSTIMSALVAAQTSMSFSGHVLGYVTAFDPNDGSGSFGNYQMIDSVGSAVQMNVDFGVANPISGSITFNPVNDTAMVWSMNIDSASSSINAATGSFDVGDFTNGTGSAVIIGAGEMHGHFYSNGTDVTSAGASFAAGGFYGGISSENVVGAVGVVKVTRD
jgi:hypothetical protein